MNKKEKIIKEYELNGWEFMSFDYIELIKIGKIDDDDIFIKKEKHFENGYITV